MYVMRKILINHVSEEGFVCRIYKDNSEIKKKENKYPSEKWEKDLNIYLYQENIEMANDT